MQDVPDRSYCRTEPSVFDLTRAALQRGATLHQAYAQTLRESEQIHLDTHESTDVQFPQMKHTAALRNTKQIQNMKYIINKKGKISSDHVLSLLELNAYDLAGFTRKILFAEDEFLGITVHPATVTLARKLIAINDKDASLPQLLTYDTTFSHSACYVTTLVMRNTISGSAHAFQLYWSCTTEKERKTHKEIFQFIKDELSLQSKVFNIPLKRSQYCSMR